MKYSLSLREILKVKSKGLSEGSGYISLYISSHNTDILNNNASIVLPADQFLVLLRQLGNTGKYCPVE